MREQTVVRPSAAEEQQREEQRCVGVTSLAKDVLDEDDRITQPTVLRE